MEPHRLVSVGRRWYLVAYDLERHDWRSFRLDRIAEPRSTGARFRPRTLPAADAAEYVRDSLAGAADALVVDAVIEAPLADVERAIGRWAAVEAAGPTRTRVRMTADSPEWALFGLAAVDAPFRIEGPREVRELAERWGRRFSAATRLVNR